MSWVSLANWILWYLIILSSGHRIGRVKPGAMDLVQSFLWISSLDMKFVSTLNQRWGWLDPLQARIQTWKAPRDIFASSASIMKMTGHLDDGFYHALRYQQSRHFKTFQGSKLRNHVPPSAASHRDSAAPSDAAARFATAPQKTWRRWLLGEIYLWWKHVWSCAELTLVFRKTTRLKHISCEGQQGSRMKCLEGLQVRKYPASEQTTMNLNFVWHLCIHFHSRTRETDAFSPLLWLHVGSACKPSSGRSLVTKLFTCKATSEFWGPATVVTLFWKAKARLLIGYDMIFNDISWYFNMY